MKYIKQFLIILVFSLLGELLSAWVPLPVPASIYGLVLLFLSLRGGLVKLDQVDTVGSFLISLFPLLFVPPVVALLDCWALVKDNLLPILSVIALSTVAVFAVSGVITQRILNRKGEKEHV